MSDEEVLAMIYDQVVEANILYPPRPMVIAVTFPLLRRIRPYPPFLSGDDTLFDLPLRVMLGAEESFFIGPIQTLPPGEETRT